MAPSKSKLVVADYMSEGPHTITGDQPLSAAHTAMRAHNIRHLPVTDNGSVVGILSMDDLHLMETLKHVDPETVPVADAMTPDPYVVSPDAPLEKVVAYMSSNKFSAAVVMKDDSLVGVFTTVDAMRALVLILRR